MTVKTDAAPADALGAIIRSRKIVDLSVIVDQFYPAFQQESQEFLMIPTHVPLTSASKSGRGVSSSRTPER